MHGIFSQNPVSDEAARALRRFEEILRLSRSAVWEVDLDGMFTYVSPSFEDLLGYRPEELLGRRTIHDFYAKEMPEDLRAELSPEWIARGEEFSEFAIPLVAKSGKIVWVSSSGAPIRDSAGRVAGARGVDTDITALKQAEESVRASEQNLWQQIQAAPMPIAFTIFAGSGALHVNRAFVRTFGYSPGEVATVDAWFEKAFPDEAGRARVRRDTEEWMALAADGGTPTPREYRITCKDGRVLDVEVAAALVAGRFVGTFTDVTMRRRELESRKAREEELRRVLDNLPFPVATSVAGPDFDWSDPRAEVTYLNRRFTSLFGYTRAEIPTVGEWALRAFPDREKRLAVFSILEDQVQAALRGEGNVGPLEVAVAALDGSVHHVLIQAEAVENQLVICLEDVSARKQAEEDLRAREAELFRILDNLPFPVTVSQIGEGGSWRDPRNKVVFLNRRHVETFGFSARDCPTVGDYMLRVHPDTANREEILARWDRELSRVALEGGTPAAMELKLRTKAGDLRDMEIGATLLEDKVVACFMDLTGRKQSERLLREQQEQLARAARVSSLGQLAASLAHELEQPLAAILHNAQTAEMILQEQGAESQGSELLEIVRDILADDRRAGSVLDRIGSMVRRQTFTTEPLGVPELLEEVATLVRPSLAERRIALEISCEEALPPIDGDRVLLQQVFLNLFLNSIDAIGRKKRGRISVHACRPAPGLVEILVRDNGGGVEPGVVEKLLTPFYSTKETGMGIGLPLVQNIIEQHGGGLRFDNEAGRGLAVRLSLPAGARRDS